MKHRLKAKIGKILIKFSLTVWVIDLLTKVVSTTIGKIICGEQYLCAVDGVVGDCSCGFNTDLHLSMVLMTLLIWGVLLVLSANKALSLP